MADPHGKHTNWSNKCGSCRVHPQSLWYSVYQTNTVENGDDHDTDKSFWSQQQEALWAPRRSTYLYTLKGLFQCNCDQKGTSNRLLDDTEALF
jgi:hypothetical protein